MLLLLFYDSFTRHRKTTVHDYFDNRLSSTDFATWLRLLGAYEIISPVTRRPIWIRDETTKPGAGYCQISKTLTLLFVIYYITVGSIHWLPIIVSPPLVTCIKRVINQLTRASELISIIYRVSARMFYNIWRKIFIDVFRKQNSISLRKNMYFL